MTRVAFFAGARGALVLVLLAQGTALAASTKHAAAPTPPAKSAAPAAAETGGGADGLFAGDLFSGKGGPIDIRADSFVLKNQVRTLIYEGSVDATQADSTLRCKTLTLHYTEDNQIRDGTCEGDVKFTAADRVVTAGTAEMVRAKNTITLTNDVRIWQGENEIRGEHAKIFVQDEHMVVEGTDENPVRTTVQSSGDAGIGFAPPQIGNKPAPKPADGAAPPKEPMHVRSSYFEGSRSAHNALYRGHVVAERGDTTLTCEELTIAFDDQNREVVKADATGGVYIVQGDRNVTADTGHFTHADQRVVLLGKPTQPVLAQHGDDHMTCQRIEYVQTSDEVRCDGNRDRIQMVIKSNPSGEGPMANPFPGIKHK